MTNLDSGAMLVQAPWTDHILSLTRDLEPHGSFGYSIAPGSGISWELWAAMLISVFRP